MRGALAGVPGVQITGSEQGIVPTPVDASVRMHNDIVGDALRTQEGEAVVLTDSIV